MAVTELTYTPGTMPEGYLPVAVSPSESAAVVRLCVLVRSKADPVGGHLVVLRETIDARVYLGCLVDTGATVHEWVEVWVQTVDGLADSLPASRGALTNADLDRRWVAMVQAYERLERPLVYRTGWEGLEGGGGKRPPPLLIDAAKGQSVDSVDRESGDRWTLCTDDKALKEAGLPAYGGTLHRYLYLPQLGAESVFVPVTRGAPTSARTRGYSDVEAGRTGLVQLNAGGGLMLVRQAGPIGFEAFVDLLGGGTWAGVPHGRSHVDTGVKVKAQDGAPPPPTATSDGAAGGSGGSGLFLGQQGRWGRLVEAYHLKLRVLADAVAGVRAVSQAGQRPLLNVRPESFQVRLGEPARGLPHLWSARVGVADPGAALALAIESATERFFVLPRAEEISIYRPAEAGRPIVGRGTVRIREVLTQQGEATVLEGTLATDEKIECSRNDLVWIRLPLGGGPVDLYGRLERDAALAAGEWRLRTLQQGHSADVKRQLGEAKGVPIGGAAFEVVPQVSTPCDLYSLGVLAVRVLLAQKGVDLPVVLDEMLSLARQVAKESASGGGSAADLPTRIGTLFGRDPRWTAALGPHRLIGEKVDPAEALDLVPGKLWWETLGAIVRMFPGIGPDSECMDLGDARPGGVHLVFDRAAADLDRLLRKSRSLIVIDWSYNREIHAVVRQYQTGVAGGGVGKR